MPTWMKIATSTTTVNHHRARVRSHGHQLAPSDQTPARPLPTMTNHAERLMEVEEQGRAVSSVR